MSDVVDSSRGVILAEAAFRRGPAAFLRRHVVASFFGLTFLISWGAWICVDRLSLGLAGVGGLVAVLGAAGPALAGVACAGLAEGWKGIKELLHRLVAWRVSGWAYLAVFAGPVVLVLLPLQLDALLGGEAPAWERMGQLPSLLPTLVSMLLIGGLTEEPGWRGFALPRLHRAHGPLAASLVLGILWGVWHIPIYTLPGLGNPLPAGPLVRFILTTPVLAVLFTALAEHTGGSVWMAVLFHAWNNTVNTGLPELLGLSGSPSLGTLNLLVWMLAVVPLLWVWLRPARPVRLKTV
jgi:membrane protease YdiL (CAAX protease family)